MRRLPCLLLLFCVLELFCTTVAELAAEEGNGGRAITEQIDLVYGEIDDQKLLVDVFSPEAEQTAEELSRPAVIFIHGGGWSSGNKTNFRPYARQLARHGYVTFCISYRLMTRDGKKTWPAQIDDVQRAVRWVRTNDRRFGIDPNRVAAAGGSAGGHLSALLGTTDTRDNSDGALAGCSSRVNAVVNIFGPTDMTDDFAPKVEAGAMVNQLVDALFAGDRAGRSEEVRAASPLFQVDDESAPFITFHGTLDKLVPLDHSERLHEALQKVGVESKLVVFEDEGHGFARPENRRRFVEETVAFLDRHLAKAQSARPEAGKNEPMLLSSALRQRMENGTGGPVKVCLFW